MTALKEKRLYLFDIDGTLISTGGAGGQAMRGAFAALWGGMDGFAGIEFSGRTDRALLREALTATGHGKEGFELDLQRFKRAYFRRLRTSLPANNGTVLPGVVGFLNRLQAEDRATLGLGTGNFRRSARMKLRHYGIDAFFCTGGFGDHSEDRAVLIGQAIRAAKQRSGRNATVFVIGDTIHDITAARANSAVAVGVTTGPASSEQLSKAGADIVLATLEGAERQLL